MSKRIDSQRLFIALNIPCELHDAVVRVQNQLNYIPGATAILWTPREQFHLTLEFLGNVATERVPDVLAALKDACRGEAPLKLTLFDAGCFPSFANPSVVWVDVAGDVIRLGELQTRIRAETHAFGDRLVTDAFSPHLTIGRHRKGIYKVPSVFGTALETEAKKIGVLGQWNAANVQLMRSKRTSCGIAYTELGIVELNA